MVGLSTLIRNQVWDDVSHDVLGGDKVNSRYMDNLRQPLRFITAFVGAQTVWNS